MEQGDFHFSKFAEAWLYSVWLLDTDGHTLAQNRAARTLLRDLDLVGRPWRNAWPDDMHIAIDLSLIHI